MPKATSKKTAKKAAPRNGRPVDEAPATEPRFSMMGYRGYCENSEHVPCTTLLCPDLTTVRYWASDLSKGMHPECGFGVERVLFDKTTFHVLSAIGHLPDDPLLGPIDWPEGAPLDLGPIWGHMTLEDLKALKDIPAAAIKAAEAALHARPAISNEAPEGEEAEEDEEAEEEEEEVEAPKAQNGQAEAASPIGQSHPAPKSESTASHRPSGHRALKVNSAKPHKAIKAKPTKKGSLKMNGKNGKSKKRV